MPKKEEIKLPSLDELFTTQEERDDAKLKKIYEIPISDIDPFPDHPFKVRDDEDMDNLVESIRAKGMITPCMVRKKQDGRYELISGHRRMHACEILGMDKIRCEVMNLSKEEATIMMVESNFQRSKILPSEKAFAYKMRLEAMKMTISRMITNKNLGQNYGGKEVAPQLEKAREHLARSYGLSEDYVQKLGTPESRKHEQNGEESCLCPVGTRDAGGALADQSSDSRRQIYRYIRLTELVPELLDLVDEGKIGLRPAVELSYLGNKQQQDLVECIEMEQCTPTHEQARRMRAMYDDGKLTSEAIEAIMLEQKPNQKERIVLHGERCSNLFPKNLPLSKREDYVIAAMQFYGRYLEQRDRSRGSENER